jgi:MFS transporter, PPP family, 3-phenylpropionic acid transporter
VRGRLRALYFLYYGYVGAFLGYFAPYLRGLGFSGDSIGAVTMAAQLVAAPAALAWAHAADRKAARPAVLRVCALGALASLAALPWVRTPLSVGAVLVAQAAFGGAVVPLLDSIAMEWARGAPERSYARTRLFGSLGFVFVAQGVGLLLAARGDRPADLLMPLAVLCCVAGYAAAAAALPDVPAPTASAHPPGLRLRDGLALLRQPAAVLLLALCAVHWAACAPYHLLFGVLVRDQGLPSSVTGAGLALGVLAEVGALSVFPALLRRFELRSLLVLGCLGTAVRWWLLSRARGAAPLVFLQLFHALTFGLWWACAVEAMARLVPVRLRATGQALFSAVVFGAGNALGYALSGIGYQRHGSASPLFALAAVAELCALPLCALAGGRLAAAARGRPLAARQSAEEGGAPPGSA